MRESRGHLVPVSLAVAALLVAVASGLLRPLERAFLDARTERFAHAAASDVVVVEIDGGTGRALERWPWSRSIHAALVRRINAAHPRAVFFDVDFSARSGHPEA